MPVCLPEHFLVWATSAKRVFRRWLTNDRHHAQVSRGAAGEGVLPARKAGGQISLGRRGPSCSSPCSTRTHSLPGKTQRWLRLERLQPSGALLVQAPKAFCRGKLRETSAELLSPAVSKPFSGCAELRTPGNTDSTTWGTWRA